MTSLKVQQTFPVAGQSEYPIDWALSEACRRAAELPISGKTLNDIHRSINDQFATELDLAKLEPILFRYATQELDRVSDGATRRDGER